MKRIPVEQRVSLKTALDIHEEGFIIPKAMSDCMSEKKETLCISKKIGAKNGSPASNNSLKVVGRKIFVLGY